MDTWCMHKMNDKYSFPPESKAQCWREFLTLTMFSANCVLPDESSSVNIISTQLLDKTMSSCSHTHTHTHTHSVKHHILLWCTHEWRWYKRAYSVRRHVLHARHIRVRNTMMIQWRWWYKRANILNWEPLLAACMHACMHASRCFELHIIEFLSSQLCCDEIIWWKVCVCVCVCARARWNGLRDLSGQVSARRTHSSASPCCAWFDHAREGLWNGVGYASAAHKQAVDVAVRRGKLLQSDKGNCCSQIRETVAVR